MPGRGYCHPGWVSLGDPGIGIEGCTVLQIVSLVIPQVETPASFSDATASLLNCSHQLLHFGSQKCQQHGGDKQCGSDATVKFNQLHGIVCHEETR